MKVTEIESSPNDPIESGVITDFQGCEPNRALITDTEILAALLEYRELARAHTILAQVGTLTGLAALGPREIKAMHLAPLELSRILAQVDLAARTIGKGYRKPTLATDLPCDSPGRLPFPATPSLLLHHSND